MLSDLKVSPAGVVPQCSQRPRPIIDYSFLAINQTTLQVALPEVMQFGHTLKRILENVMYTNPHFGPVKMIKIDLADGYYRVPISACSLRALAVNLLTSFQEALIALPLMFPMCWLVSPPYFCMCTETITDITNKQLEGQGPSWSKLHLLEASTDMSHQQDTSLGHSEMHYTIPNKHKLAKPSAKADIYFDDFIGLAQT